MTREDMQHSMELLSLAERLNRQLTKYVLLKRDHGSKAEIINVGDPVKFRKDEYNRMEVVIPEDARRFVFNLWRKETARKFNEVVRALNQLGVTHDYKLIAFKPLNGEPIL